MHSILCPVASEYDSLISEFSSVGVLRALWLPGLRATYVDDKVAAWRDLVKGYLLEQDDADARFTVSSTGWNGRRMFTCAGAQFMTCEHEDWNTLFGGDDADCALMLVHDLADSTMPLGLYGATASHRIAMWFASSTARLIREGTDFSGGAGSQGSGLRHHVVKNVGAVASVYRNGLLVATGALDAASQTLERLAVCAMVIPEGNPTTFATGDIGAIALYSNINDEAALGMQVGRRGYDVQISAVISEPEVLMVGLPTLASLTATSDGNYEVSLDADFASVLQTITVSGGTGSGWIEPLVADANKSMLYVRPDGGSLCGSLAVTPVSSRILQSVRAGSYTNHGYMGSIFDVAEIGGAVTTNATGGPDSQPCWQPQAASGGYLRSQNDPYPYLRQPFHIFAVTKDDGGGGNALLGSNIDRLVVSSGDLNCYTGQSNILTGVTATTWHAVEWVAFGNIGGARSAAAADYQDGPAAGLSINAWTYTTIGGYGAGSSRSNSSTAAVYICDGVCTDAERQSILATLNATYPSLSVTEPASSYYDLELDLGDLSGTYAIGMLGQSNIEGRAASGSESFGANINVFTLAGAVEAATHPYADPAGCHWGAFYDTDADESLAAAMANDLQPLFAADVLLVPCCQGGTGNVAWSPGGSNSGLADTPASLYGGSVHRLRNVVAAGATLPAIVYYRFENELAGTGLDTYQANTLATIDGLLAEFPGVHIFLVLGTWTGYDTDNYAIISAAMDAIVAARSNVHKITVPNTADVHATGTENNTIGAYLAAAMAPILGLT
jgi:hypothetical protein